MGRKKINTTLDHLNIPRFMRHVKKVNPEKRCFLQYDKLYIDGKVFMFNETTGKVFNKIKMTIMLMLRWRSKWREAWRDRRQLPILGKRVGRGPFYEYQDENDEQSGNIDDGNHLRAETRTPGLSRKSNSTLSLVNDVEMEVPLLLHIEWQNS